MTISLNGASVDTGPVAPAAPAPRAQASLLATLGANDPVAVARQQLPSAVASTPNPPKIPANIPQQPKALVRVPSSPLAAQFIAQDSSLTTDDLEIFASQTAAPEAAVPEADDYLTSLRIARGDVPAPKPTKEAAGATMVQQKAAQAANEAQATATSTKAASTTSNETSMRSGVAAFAASLPPLAAPLLKRISLATTRGAQAYQLALARNASAKPTATAAAL